MIKLQDPSLLGSSSFIANSFTSSDNPHLEVHNPFTQSAVHTLTAATEDDVSKAAESTRKAFEHWRTVSLKDRTSLLLVWHEQVQRNKSDLARLLTYETGKPLSQSSAEVDYAASFLTWCAQPVLQAVQTPATPTTDVRVESTTIPVGPVLAITPWNLPLALLARKVAPAVAAGCAVVAKPCTRAPLTALAFAELGRRAGFPAGLFNVVVTENAADSVRRIVEMGDIRKISFTGGMQGGRSIAEVGARFGIQVCLELGGNAPMLVFDDCDVETVVTALVDNKCRMSGQTCIAVNRVLLQRGVYDAVTARLCQRVRHTKCGDGFDEDVQLGALIDQAAVECVRDKVEAAVHAGARVSARGEIVEGGHGCVELMVMEGVRDEMGVARDETFGPVISLLAFDEEEEGVRRANEGGGGAGLAAYVFSENGRRASRAADGLRFGMIGVNCVRLSDSSTSFGGMHKSGQGREGGLTAVSAFTERRHVVWRA